MLEWLKKEMEKAHQANLKVIADAGCIMEQSMSGYWRLVNQDGDLLHDDSACEDVYSEDTAAYIFAEMIKEDGIKKS